MGLSRRQTAGGLVASGALLPLAGLARAAGRPATDLADVDMAVRPGDDFFRYANGRWLATTVIPPDQPGWNEFSRLGELNLQRERTMLEAAAGATDATSRKLGTLYASFADAGAAEALGLRPVQPELQRIGAVSDRSALARELAWLSRDTLVDPFSALQAPSPIAVQYFPDLGDPERTIPVITQGGLGAPDRAYLLDAKFAAVQTAYRAHLAAMFALAGMANADARGARVFALEQRLAATQWTRAAQRDLAKRNNRFTAATLAARVPGLDWPAFLAAAGLTSASTLLVGEPDAIAAAAELAQTVSLEDWRDYLASRALRRFAAAGPRAVYAEWFGYAEHTLTGTPEPPARWKRAAALTDLAMGPALGQIYLRSYFPPAAQAAAVRMTDAIKAAMARRLGAIDWMAPQTKAEATAKLASLRIEVGGERRPRDYRALAVTPGQAYANLLAAARFEYDRSRAKLDHSADRGEWLLVPQSINAMANPMLNKLMFPAGIMQPPFFDPANDDAVNYGGIGMLMGHELSHIFDDQGAQFDARGVMRDWWTAADRARFAAAGAALVAQYDAYEPLPGAHINGRLSLGENIGDLAGLALAYDAYRQTLNGREAPVVGGLTGDQRFFLSFARCWRALTREPLLRRQTVAGLHPPQRWRVATARNQDAWYTAFGVKPGDAMYLPPEQRVQVW